MLRLLLFVWAIAVASAGEIAVVTEETQDVSRVVVSLDPEQERLSSSEASDVTISATVNVVDGQKFQRLFPAALALAPVSRDDSQSPRVTLFAMPTLNCRSVLAVRTNPLATRGAESRHPVVIQKMESLRAKLTSGLAFVASPRCANQETKARLSSPASAGMRTKTRHFPMEPKCEIGSAIRALGGTSGAAARSSAPLALTSPLSCRRLPTRHRAVFLNRSIRDVEKRRLTMEALRAGFRSQSFSAHCV